MSTTHHITSQGRVSAAGGGRHRRLRGRPAWTAGPALAGERDAARGESPRRSDVGRRAVRRWVRRLPPWIERDADAGEGLLALAAAPAARTQSPPEQRVLQMRYRGDQTQEAVAEVLGLSRVRITRLEH